MRWWRPDVTRATEVLSGRDLRSGGIWLGLTRCGRFAAVTNVRDSKPNPVDAPSRGLLPLRYLLGTRPLDGSPMSDCSPLAYAQALDGSGSTYAGFNLLLGDMRSGTMHWLTNHPGHGCQVMAGIHGLSNAALDTPWPKVEVLKATLAQASDLDDADPFAVLTHAMQNTSTASDADLPQTGVGHEWERALSAAFIRLPGYGTRCTTLVELRFDGSALLRELQHAPEVTSPVDFVWNWRSGESPVSMPTQAP
jgi:uncharacterized protein with NRDE domain